MRSCHFRSRPTAEHSEPRALPRTARGWHCFLLSPWGLGLVLAWVSVVASCVPAAAPLFVVPPEWENGPNTTPCQTANDDVVTFPCRFSATPSQRSAWSAKVALDLRSVAGVSFRFRAADASAFYRFFLYFQSGSGWYGVSLSPRGSGDWETLTAWKSATFTEGRTAGWGKITQLRIAVSPAAPRDATFDVSGFERVAGDPRLLVLRATSALDNVGSSEARGITDFPDRLTKALRRVGVDPVFVDDVDFTPALAQRMGTKVLILPYNHLMDDRVSGAVATAVEQGCFVLGFYLLPASLEPLLGLHGGPTVSATTIRGGVAGIQFRMGSPNGMPARVPQSSWIFQDLRPTVGSQAQLIGTWATQNWESLDYAAVARTPGGIWMSHVYLDSEPETGSRMLLAMAAVRLPDLWETAARTAADELATLGTSETIQPRQQQVAALIDQGRFRDALETAEVAKREDQRAFLLAQSSRPNEFRGAWCHRGYGISGWTWDQSVRQLRDCGFNALFPNMTWAGLAFYPSRIIPSAPIVAEQGDQFRQCADACRRYGVQLHAWIVCFNLGDDVPASWLDTLQKAGRLQVNSRGKVNPRWICPANPANSRQLQAEVSEILRNYSVQGIHLDFIRYPDQDHCFCAECRRLFASSATVHLEADWAGQVRKNPALMAKWREFRRQIITRNVREIREVIRAEKKNVELSAAVYDNPHSARDVLGQDWLAWCTSGYLDFATPMNYTPETSFFQDTVRRQLADLKGTPVRLYPGIGARSVHLTPVQTAQQIGVTRRLETGGFVLFEYNFDEATQLFPELARGVTKP